MSKAVVLQHVAYEGPGRIASVFRDFGIPLEIRHLDRGDELPRNLEEVRILVVMGGPMNVSDAGTRRYPFLAPEIELIQRMIADDRPMLGICLGAQLLAHAARAKVYPGPAGEIGFAPVSFPFPGGTDPILFGLAEGAPMFHWHFQTFDLPKLPRAVPPAAGGAPAGCVLLSSTTTCRNQAFRLKTRLFGFQYHIEMTEEGIEAMLANCRDDAVKVLGADAVNKIRGDSKHNYSRYRRDGDRIIENLVQFLRAY